MNNKVCPCKNTSQFKLYINLLERVSTLVEVWFVHGWRALHPHLICLSACIPARVTVGSASCCWIEPGTKRSSSTTNWDVDSSEMATMPSLRAAKCVCVLLGQELQPNCDIFLCHGGSVKGNTVRVGPTVWPAFQLGISWWTSKTSSICKHQRYLSRSRMACISTVCSYVSNQISPISLEVQS